MFMAAAPEGNDNLDFEREEAAILGFPAVTIRNSMERPEAMNHGNIILCGLEARVVEAATAPAERSR